MGVKSQPYLIDSKRVIVNLIDEKGHEIHRLANKVRFDGLDYEFAVHHKTDEGLEVEKYSVSELSSGMAILHADSRKKAVTETWELLTAHKNSRSDFESAVILALEMRSENAERSRKQRKTGEHKPCRSRKSPHR